MTFDPAVELARQCKELEIETTRHQKDLELLTQRMSQAERDSQLALKQRQQAHDEDVERLCREMVWSPIIISIMFLISALVAKHRTMNMS